MARKIRCHFKTLSAPQISESTQISTLTSILGAYGIGVEFVSGESLTLPSYNVRTYPIVDVDCRLSQTTSQQEDLFNQGNYTAIQPLDIVCYFVQTINNVDGLLLNGCAAHPLFKPRVVLARTATLWTLAHEIGHVLGLAHVSDAANLMFSPTARITANPPSLTSAQISTLQSSPYLIST